MITIEFKFNFGDKVKEIEGTVEGEIVEVRAYADGAKGAGVKTADAQLRIEADKVEIDGEAGENTGDEDKEDKDNEGEGEGDGGEEETL